MKMYEVQMTMEKIKAARKEWATRHRVVNEQAATAMRRLIHEAAAHRMSVDMVAKHSGYPKSRIREMMRQMGLDPRWSKTMLATVSAAALHENAELLGIDPAAMDLMSPLAYLPMGEQLRDELRAEATRGVTEVPEIEDEPVDYLALVAPLIADITACGHDHEGKCGDCQEGAQRVINVVLGARA